MSKKTTVSKKATKSKRVSKKNSPLAWRDTRQDIVLAPGFVTHCKLPRYGKVQVLVHKASNWPGRWTAQIIESAKLPLDAGVGVHGFQSAEAAKAYVEEWSGGKKSKGAKSKKKAGRL